MKLKYPKFTVLLLTFVFVYFLFSWIDLESKIGQTSSHGFFSAFVAGVLYVYGFTAAFGTGILLSLLKDQNLFASVIVAAAGSLMGDLIIFRLIREYFGDEIMQLSESKGLAWLVRKLPDAVRRFGLTLLGFLIVASPLPDEVGVSLIATGRISGTWFAILSFVLNAVGILAIILVGRS